MNKLTGIALATALFAGATPALAKTDCDGGFKNFMGKMSIYVDKTSGDELADAIRKSLDAYNSCKAGDNFSPRGVWDQIITDMKTKAGQ
jgi:hypothetical protein